MSSVSVGKIWLMAGAGRMSGDKRRMATFCLQEKDDFRDIGQKVLFHTFYIPITPVYVPTL